MTRQRRARRAILPAAAVAVALTFGLSACGASSEGTSAAMHASVVQIAERAAAGDYAGALAELALLDRDVTSASENGTIDAAREAEIRAAMDLVRADLEAADAPATPTPEPAPAPEPTTAPADDDGGDDPGNSDNKGKGNNNGNDDKGKDGGDD
ncbi:hypothetical protein EV187_3241 [Agromyces ramosus]|jgi:hypothetical protein|uniref:Mucin-associated surface protein n=1 Tax=Agromyces ramosus TaxID=33879 RepID=A0A4Q7MC27_9MICO|nr:hypothetical protein [Agromyces ramosus]RZS64853.1 hypothetical protein EV187_3241 [Agromyces ramosus]